VTFPPDFGVSAPLVATSAVAQQRWPTARLSLLDLDASTGDLQALILQWSGDHNGSEGFRPFIRGIKVQKKG